MDKSQLTCVNSRKSKCETTHPELDNSDLLKSIVGCRDFVNIIKENSSKYYDLNHLQLLNNFNHLGE